MVKDYDKSFEHDGVSGPSSRDYSEDVDTQFRLHDKVEWLGATGTITRISTAPYTLMQDFPIGVTMASGHEMNFTADGRFLKTQEPTLKVLERPTMITVTRWLHAVRSSDGEWLLSGYHTEEELRSIHKGPYQRIVASEKTFEEAV